MATHIHAHTRSLRRDGLHLLLPADDAYLASIPGSQRLCHLLEAVETDFITTSPFDAPPSRDRDRGVDLDDWTTRRPSAEEDADAVLDVDDEDDRRVQLWY